MLWGWWGDMHAPVQRSSHNDSTALHLVQQMVAFSLTAVSEPSKTISNYPLAKL